MKRLRFEKMYVLQGIKMYLEGDEMQGFFRSLTRHAHFLLRKMLTVSFSLFWWLHGFHLNAIAPEEGKYNQRKLIKGWFKNKTFFWQAALQAITSCRSQRKIEASFHFDVAWLSFLAVIVVIRLLIFFQASVADRRENSRLLLKGVLCPCGVICCPQGIRKMLINHLFK